MHLPEISTAGNEFCFFFPTFFKTMTWRLQMSCFCVFPKFFARDFVMALAETRERCICAWFWQWLEKEMCVTKGFFFLKHFQNICFLSLFILRENLPPLFFFFFFFLFFVFEEKKRGKGEGKEETYCDDSIVFGGNCFGNSTLLHFAFFQKPMLASPGRRFVSGAKGFSLVCGKKKIIGKPILDLTLLFLRLFSFCFSFSCFGWIWFFFLLFLGLSRESEI